MSSMVCLRGAWIVEFYRKSGCPDWNADLLVAKRFIAVEAMMRQRAALTDADTTDYWHLSHASDDAIVRAVAASQRIAIAGGLTVPDDVQADTH